MAELDLSVLVSRSLLGNTPLECNDGIRFKAVTLIGAMVDWSRTQIEGPYTDGSITTDRHLQKVMESPSFEVYGITANQSTPTVQQMRNNMDTLVRAFLQDNFTITITIDGAVFSYQAEAAGYQLEFTTARLAVKEGKVTFSMPRQPVALVGTV